MGQVIDRLESKGFGHAPMGSHSINGKREGRDNAIDGGTFKKQGFSPARRLHLTVRPFSNFQLSRDRFTDPDQFTRFLKLVDKMRKRSVGHGGSFEYQALNGKRFRTGNRSPRSFARSAATTA